MSQNQQHFQAPELKRIFYQISISSVSYILLYQTRPLAYTYYANKCTGCKLGSGTNSRVKKILEQVSRTRFLTGFEFRALSFGAMQQGRKGREIQIS